MPRVSPQHREAQREAILKAAQWCFAREGFHQTSMDDVVARSKLSKGAVYGYFASKDDIIAALADSRHAAEDALNRVAMDHADPIAALKSLVRAYAADLAEKAGADRRRVQLYSWAESLRDARVRGGVLAGLEAPRGAIARLIASGQASGCIDKSLNREAVARTFIALFQGMVLQVAWGEKVDIDACMRVAEQYVDGLARPSARKAKGKRVS